MNDYRIPDEQKFKAELRSLGFDDGAINAAYDSYKKGLNQFELSPEASQRTLDAIAEKHPELFKKEETLFERIKRYFLG